MIKIHTLGLLLGGSCMPSATTVVLFHLSSCMVKGLLVTEQDAESDRRLRSSSTLKRKGSAWLCKHRRSH